MTDDYTHDPHVEAMIAKWLEYNDQWRLAQGDPDDTYKLERDYITYYELNEMTADPRETPWDSEVTTIVSAWCRVADELNQLTLLGIFQGEDLIYATAEIDTDWGEFYAGSYPIGLIDTTKPYVREDKFLNLPER